MMIQTIYLSEGLKRKKTLIATINPTRVQIDQEKFILHPLLNLEYWLVVSLHTIELIYPWRQVTTLE
jgi:hypothetical protein